jgi:hypothetical protein
MANETRSPRFVLWLAYLVFSIITLGSVVEVVKDNDLAFGRTSGGSWSIACSAITFTITAIVNLMHLNSVSSIFIVGTKVEGGLCALLVIFWVALVAVVTDSRQGLAVDEVGAVDNGNLYYFSWAGFVCSILLLTSYLQDAFGINVAGELRNRSPRLSFWSAHLATAIVVMGSSANFYDSTCGLGRNEKCNRAVYGIVYGALATLGAVGIVGIKIATSKAPFLVESLVALILVVLSGFGVAFITAQDGPGAELGNLYYFTWASFLTSFMLLASCVEDYNAASIPAGEVPEPISSAGSGDSESGLPASP